MPQARKTHAISGLASDIILDWIHDDGYSLSDAGWICLQEHEFYFEISEEKDGHRHIARAPDRETAVAQLGMLIRYPLDE